ncbi:uncharacterized protein N7511_008218 [Penicillium nucicola]|uniref:uncharacterized protein n=1 Tax=Penicillium nucicola TaxID=1850975 RepID=UPI002544F520|nr:uncharacterized protein N7511_008218 [Penicillium nucicola]KAJ5754065.1 hypothetical protein N7511_008218 [Penicillium nucicola]
MPQAVWDDERHKKLLLAIMANQPKLDYEAVSKSMDDGTKAASIREHIRQLKMRVSSTNSTPNASPAKKEKGPKAKRANSKATQAERPSKTRRLTITDPLEFDRGYATDQMETNNSEAESPRKDLKVKDEPLDDATLPKSKMQYQDEAGLATEADDKMSCDL